MRFQSTTDHAVFTGATYEEVVQQMADASHQPDERRDVATFMARTAVRVRRMTGRNVKSFSAEAFLTGLIDAELLKPLADTPTPKETLS